MPESVFETTKDGERGRDQKKKTIKCSSLFSKNKGSNVKQKGKQSTTTIPKLRKEIRTDTSKKRRAMGSTSRRKRKKRCAADRQSRIAARGKRKCGALNGSRGARDLTRRRIKEVGGNVGPAYQSASDQLAKRC